MAVQRFSSANGDVAKSTDIFLALNNAILAGGASSEIQASALEQLSQAYAKGKPDMMEWRTAMTAMPAQLKQVATAMGYVSADELGEALRNGEVSMDEFMEKITELNEEGIDGFQSFEQQAKNSTGGIATSITVAKTQVVKGVADIIKALDVRLESLGLGSVSKLIANIGDEAKKGLDIIAGLIAGELTISDVMEKATNLVSTFIDTINQNLPSIIETGMTMIAELIKGIAQALPTLIPKMLETVMIIVEALLDNIDLIITDIMMPGIDGYKFTESLRREKIDIPILMITAKEEFKDKVMGFNVGADDYLVKPINLEELLLRVGAILRRAKINNEKKVAIGTTVLDYNTFTVETGNEKIELPQKEFNILFKLFSYPNQIFTRTQLMNEFWGMLSESDERTIDVHINRLRDKFKDNPNFEIITVRGLGYKVVKKDE